MPNPRPRPVDQLAMDETPIDDDELAEALEERLRQQQAAGEARKRYDVAHTAAMAHIERQELPEGVIARVGRFRITRSSVTAKTVSFETKPHSRVRITLVDGAGEE